MFLQKGAGGLNLSSVQMAQGNAVPQGGTFNMQGHIVSPGPLQNTIQQQHTVQPQTQQQTLLREQGAALAQVRRAELSFRFFLSDRSRTQPLHFTLALCVAVSAAISHSAAAAKSTSRTSVQHHDDPSAEPDQRGPDRHQPGPEYGTKRSCCGHVCTGPSHSD